MAELNYTKEKLARWLRAELVDLVQDIESVRKSDMPEFNQGLDVICAYDTKVEKILEKLGIPDLYKALKGTSKWVEALIDTGKLNHPIDRAMKQLIDKILAKVEDK